MIARLSIYTLSDCTIAYLPLLARLLSPKTIGNTSIAILIDWTQPWTMARSLRAWIRLLRRALQTTTDDISEALEANNTRWLRVREKDTITSITDTPTSLPLGPGEFDEPLGLPLTVVCHDAQAIERLEKQHGFKDPHLDHIQQFLRTVLLKHGAGLIFTMPAAPGDLQPMVHKMLHLDADRAGNTLAGRRQDKHIAYNVVDADRVLIPPGWDSWAKIKVLKESFDLEKLSSAWSEAIAIVDSDPEPSTDSTSPDTTQDENNVNSPVAITLFESNIPDAPPRRQPRIPETVPHTPEQVFLAAQLKRLEDYWAQDKEQEAREKASRASSVRNNETTGLPDSPSGGGRDGGGLAQTIGPVQVNMGGINFDAEETVRRLQERYRNTNNNTNSNMDFSTPDRSVAAADYSELNTPVSQLQLGHHGAAGGVSSPGANAATATGSRLPGAEGSSPAAADVGSLEKFFTGMKRGTPGSVRSGSPRTGTGMGTGTTPKSSAA